MGGEWWKAFFADLFGEVQGACIDPDRTAAEAGLLRRLLRLEGPSELLDVPCGNGRLGLELARDGHRVTGVDLSAPRLAEARAEALRRGLSLELLEADMRELPWENRFEAAWCYWGSFGYFGDEGDASFLAAVARSLVPGGRFLVETHVLETLLPRFQPRGWAPAGEALLLEDRRYDPSTGRLVVEWTRVGDRGREAVSRTSSVRVYTYRELSLALAAAGFEDVRGYDPFTGEAFRLGASRLAMVATRRAAG